MKDCGLLQASEDLGYFYKKRLLIEAHVDNLLTIKIKEEFDKAEKIIQQYVELDISGILIKVLEIEITWDNEEVFLIQQRLVEILRIQYSVTGMKQSLPLNP